MKLTPILTIAACSAIFAGAASAQMDDYHGFDEKTVDALNEKLEQPITDEALAALSQHTEVEACGGTQAVEMNAPQGWDARLANANPPGGDVPMPVPTAALAPDYPPLYEVLGVEGVCHAMFDVTADGKTDNIMTNCTLPGFAEATQDMLEPLEFTAADGQDSPATSDILLPINYCRPDKEEGGKSQ
ncbi:hypothetical protein [Henriciella aquimarina]|uniref:hypothetical protein n=1 Tax=Henriciella aquimarina TaxID=545261 RepID=UPI000A038E5E|nr:hypothetical protein [Henriciella aquimarina]